MRSETGVIAGETKVRLNYTRLRAFSAIVTAILLLTPAAAQTPDSSRAALAGQTSAPDFAKRLETAIDKASTIEEALSLLKDFAPSVKDGGSRRVLYLRWAALLELSGQWEDAAARYEEAAFAAPGQRDTGSLVSSARTLLAAGETEKALSILKVLEVASVDPCERARILILKGWASLIEGRTSDARDLAERSVDQNTDPEVQLAALTLLWASSENAARGAVAVRIRKTFPGSPEAKMTETGNVPASAHWLLTQASGAISPAGKEKSTAKSGTPEAVPEGPGDAASSSSTKITAYQVGAFSEESNAAALEKELSRKGFSPSVTRKERDGKPIWSVTVSAGEDAQTTLLRIKDAGYEAYPIF